MGVRSLFDRIVSLFVALLPRRVWDNWDLPVQNVALASSMLTLVAGVVVGIPGYFAFLERLYGDRGISMLEIAKRQVEGQLPETAAVSGIAGAAGMLAPVAFAFFTPLGLSATYLVLTGLVRAVSAYIDEAFGDPLLTGVDMLARRLWGSRKQRATRVARERLEGADEPDRRYDGEWAGLDGVDFVIVTARRKHDWHKGTVVITGDGWFVLGEPFDRPMPNGLRTVYPLTRHTTLEVLRKGVSYELPPLRPAIARKRSSTDSTDSTD